MVKRIRAGMRINLGKTETQEKAGINLEKTEAREKMKVIQEETERIWGKMEINREVQKRTPAETSLSPAEADLEKMWIRPEGTSRRGIRLALVWIPSRNPLP